MLCKCFICNTEFESKRKRLVCDSCRHPKCVVCGKTFTRKLFTDNGKPYIQMTCSRKCSGAYGKINGTYTNINKIATAAKKKKYELPELDNAHIVNIVKSIKFCAYCKKIFIREKNQQILCKNKHYRRCVICGKHFLIKNPSERTVTCSDECRCIQIKKTCLDKYGNECVLNSDYGKSHREKTCIEKYGVRHYAQSEQSKQHFRDVMLSRYGVTSPLQSKEILLRAQETNLERYGGISPTTNPDVMKKVIATNIERYGGVGTASPITGEKIKHTLLERYGVSHVSKIPGITERRMATNITRYGVPSPMQNAQIRHKAELTSLKRYGYRHYRSNPKFSMEIFEYVFKKYGVSNPIYIDGVIEKAKSTFMKRYGVPFFVLTKKCNEANKHTRISKLNMTFSEMLNSHGISHEMEYVIGARPYDFKINNTVIEIDPTITHNASICIFKGHNPKPPTYHLDKTKLAWMRGMRCIHIFDWDNYDDIIPMISQNERIFARNCESKRIDSSDVVEFVNSNHAYTGLLRFKQHDVCYGLFYGSQLVSAMSFTKSGLSDFDCDYILSMCCSKYGYSVIGGVSKLFSAFKRDNPDRSVISYCDLSKFTGMVYSILGFEYVGRVEPLKLWSDNKHVWIDSDANSSIESLFTYLDSDLLIQDVDEGRMISSKVYSMYNCGYDVYIYSNN